MKKITLLLCIVMIICALLQPCAFAEAQNCTLTLSYSKNNVAFSDMEINIYRVADLNFEKTAPFDKYPVSVSDVKSQTEWSAIASALSGYVQADKLTPCKSAKTDANGNAVFESVEVGLYLIGGVAVENGGKVFTFYDSMLFLKEDVTVKPKSEEITVPKKEYSVIKLWKDSGKDRPETVTVDILKNGTLAETVLLNESNNWQYTFTTEDMTANWSVVEKNVADGYTVTVTEKDSSFVIVNTKTDINNTPSVDTGDNSPIEIYILAFCISGLMLIILGIAKRRRENADKK